ncbi:AIPR family protein, partial [Brachyspira innocens]
MTELENTIIKNKLLELQEREDIKEFISMRKRENDNTIPLCFVIFTLQRFLNNYSSEILTDITDGPDDNMIDIFNINTKNKNNIINIFQVKYKTESNLNTTIQSNDIESFLNKIEKVFIRGDIDNIRFNNYLLAKYNEYKDLEKSSHIRFNLFLVTNGNDISEYDKKEIDKFEKRNHLFKVKVINDFNFFITKIHNSEDSIYKMTLESQEHLTIKDSIISYVVNVKTYEICSLYEKYGEHILDENVRKRIKSQLNNKIKKSIVDEPKMFWYKNNGISIICKRAEIIPLGGMTTIELEEPYIINGGQTTTTLYNIFKKDRNNKIFYDSSILVRIYQTTQQDLIDKIVIGTNQQNKITEYDLRSKNENLKKLKIFFESKDISLLIERNVEEKINKKRNITSDYLLQIYCSMYRKVP